MTLDKNQIRLLQMVIKAAETGGYCHGNGAIWVILAHGHTAAKPSLLVIDHVRGTLKEMSGDEAKKYLASTPAHTDKAAAESLRNFIK